jgi:multidrug transporter EmrE-like cation transporter
VSMSNTMFMYWILVIVASLMNVLGVFLVKLQINLISPQLSMNTLKGVGSLFYSLLQSPSALLGGGLVFLAPVPVAIVLTKMEISIVYPILVALTCLFLFPITFFYLGETMSKEKVIGVCLLVLSLYFLFQDSI